MSTPKIGGSQAPVTPPISNEGGDAQGAQTPKQPAGPSTKDTFETSGKKIDLFPKDVLEKAAKLTPQQEVNAQLNTLKNATTVNERAKAMENLRLSMQNMSPDEKAKALVDPGVKKTILEIAGDTKSPAAQFVKDLMKGTVGDIAKGVQAVKPDVDVDFKTGELKKAGVKVDVGNLLRLIQKDYQDIL
jgi:hypothetical protein